MNKRERNRFLTAALLCAACVVSIAAVHVYGKGRRVQGPDHTLGDPGLAVVLTARSEDAYGIWKRAGFRGRIVVSLSKRLNFVPLEAAVPLQRKSGAGRIENPADRAEALLTADSFLRVAMEQGIVRKIVHVLPLEDYEQKLGFARGRPGVTLTRSGISYPHNGSPRLLTTMPMLERFREPVLWYVNASFFREDGPEAVYASLKGTGIRTDSIVLCRAEDDGEVTTRDRERLERFAALLAGRGGGYE